MKWRIVLLTLCVAALSVINMGCEDDSDSRSKANYLLSGDASGSQMVPPVSGAGSGTITGIYNPKTRVLTYTNTWSGLSGAPMGGGFYTGASGENGTAIGNPWIFEANATGNGTHSGTMNLSEDQGKQLTSGNWYYRYNTAANPSGEVRGQITATQEEKD